MKKNSFLVKDVFGENIFKILTYTYDEQFFLTNQVQQITDTKLIKLIIDSITIYFLS